MNLLFITRRIDRDDGLAGFSYQWGKAITNHVEQISVICLEQGVTGLLVDINNLGQAVETLEMILPEPDLAQNLCLGAKSNYLVRFNTDFTKRLLLSSGVI